MDSKQENKQARVYLLGDSITQGLGSKKINFTDELQRLLGKSYQVINLAYTGTMIDYALELVKHNQLTASSSGDTYCVVLYGNVDAQIRPNSKGRVFPHIPERYQKNGMLMPRPFYSKSALKSAGQHIDNLQRKFYASLIKLVDGTEQWMPIEPFSTYYAQLIEDLTKLKMTTILCSCVYIDEKLFPGCPEQFEIYNGTIKNLAESNSLKFIDFYDLFRTKVDKSGWDSCYNKDHFHPNTEGYRLIAEHIANEIHHE
jgi:lysophospholipase L1-like esterase